MPSGSIERYDIRETTASKIFGSVFNTLEKNTLGINLGIYSVALWGLAVALRTVRPFAKFRKPSQIPKIFFEQNVKLTGKIIGIQPGEKPLLLMEHKPLIGSIFRQPGEGIPIEIEGIDISTNGVCWLQTIVKGQDVDVVLLTPNDLSASCIVSTKKTNCNIANHLISIGFASVGPFNLTLNNNKLFQKYYENLLKEEIVAEKKKVGAAVLDLKQLTLAYKYVLKLFLYIYKLASLSKAREQIVIR